MQCEGCPTGRFKGKAGVSNVCRACRPGTFQRDAGAWFCRVCPPGKFSHARAGDGILACSTCPSGQFSRGATAGCEPCPESLSGGDFSVPAVSQEGGVFWTCSAYARAQEEQRKTQAPSQAPTPTPTAAPTPMLVLQASFVVELRFGLSPADVAAFRRFDKTAAAAAAAAVAAAAWLPPSEGLAPFWFKRHSSGRVIIKFQVLRRFAPAGPGAQDA
jgi:hypothetical protein